MCFVTFGQRTYIYGIVKDSASQDVMIGAHIQNLNAGLLTSTGPSGKFKIPAKVGDTLFLSSVGHKSLGWRVEETWFDGSEIDFLLPVNTIYLEEVVVGEFPEYVRFKDQLLNTEVEDSVYEGYGVPRVKMNPYPQMEKKQYLHPAYVLFHPISAIHHSVSKREKEKRKMQSIRRQKHLTERVNVKFTREWVSDATNLDGDKLTSFIEYCNFSNKYLSETPLYIIHEQMMALLPDFLEAYDQG